MGLDTPHGTWKLLVPGSSKHLYCSGLARLSCVTNNPKISVASTRFISYSHHLSTASPLGRRPYSAHRIATIWDAAGHCGRGKQRAGKSQTGPSIFPLELGHVPCIHISLAKVPRPQLTPVRQGSAISMCTGSAGGRVSGSYQPCAQWRGWQHC